MSTELAEKEFQYVAAQLTTDELIELNRRVVAGKISGQYFVDQFSVGALGDCGCMFGSIGLIRDRLTPRSSMGDGLNYRDELLGGDVKRYISAFDEAIFTDLENRLYAVRLGDTPETNETSDWLHGLLVDEITRRTS